MTLKEKEQRVGAKIGDFIKIEHLNDPYRNDYNGRVGRITNIDDAMQIHGTWGGLALSKNYGDRFTVIQDGASN